MGVLPETVTEAQLGNQLVIGTVKQVGLELLLEGQDGSGRPDVWWQTVPGAAMLKARDAMVFFVLGTASRWHSQ